MNNAEKLVRHIKDMGIDRVRYGIQERRCKRGIHDFQQHCGMPDWTICQCGLYGPETQDYLNGVK